MKKPTRKAESQIVLTGSSDMSMSIDRKLEALDDNDEDSSPSNLSLRIAVVNPAQGDKSKDFTDLATPENQQEKPKVSQLGLKKSNSHLNTSYVDSNLDGSSLAQQHPDHSLNDTMRTNTYAYIGHEEKV